MNGNHHASLVALPNMGGMASTLAPKHKPNFTATPTTSFAVAVGNLGVSAV